jgi:hypothetical protein
MVVDAPRQRLGNPFDRAQIGQPRTPDRLRRPEMGQQRALARRAHPGTVERRGQPPWPASRGARRSQSGAPRRAGAGRNRAPGRCDRSAKGRAPGRWNSSLPASRSIPLATPTTGTSPARDRPALRPPRRPAPRRHRSTEGRASRLRPVRVFLQRRLKRRSSTSFIIPKSSPGDRSSPRMLNLRYCFFEAFGPGHDHRAHRMWRPGYASCRRPRSAPAARRARRPRPAPPAACPAPAVSAMRRPSAWRALRIARDQLGLLAPLRHEDLAPFARPSPTAPPASRSASSIGWLSRMPSAASCRHRTGQERRPAFLAPRRPRRCAGRSPGCPSSDGRG